MAKETHIKTDKNPLSAGVLGSYDISYVLITYIFDRSGFHLPLLSHIFMAIMVETGVETVRKRGGNDRVASTWQTRIGFYRKISR